MVCMRIYLDHNATTPLAPEVGEVMARHWAMFAGNAASAHEEGRGARRLLENARREIGRLLGADVDGLHPDLVILTSGGTESNNLALLGLAGSPPGRVLLSAIEHPSVLEAGRHLQQAGFDVQHIRVGPDGVLDVSHFTQLLTPQTRLVSVMLANNETGVMQPIRELADRCADRRVPLHTDAVQAVGKIPVHFRSLGVAGLSLSAHKLHGPRGIGALILRAGTPLLPQLHGGSQQHGLRAGTEPVELAMGLLATLQLWEREAESRRAKLVALRNRLEDGIQERIPTAVIMGQSASRLPHTTNIAFPGLNRQALLMALDQAGIACSTGSACESGASRPSHVLTAMGCPEEWVAGALRLSVGCTNTLDEVAEAARRMGELVRSWIPGRNG